jgi:hypothetical protein
LGLDPRLSNGKQLKISMNRRTVKGKAGGQGVAKGGGKRYKQFRKIILEISGKVYENGI